MDVSMTPEVASGVGSNPASGIARHSVFAKHFFAEHNAVEKGIDVMGGAPTLYSNRTMYFPSHRTGSNPDDSIGDRTISIITPPNLFLISCLLPPIKCCDCVTGHTGFEKFDEMSGIRTKPGYAYGQTENLKLPVISGSNPLGTIGVQVFFSINSRLLSSSAHHSYVAGTHSITPPIRTNFVPAYLDYQGGL